MLKYHESDGISFDGDVFSCWLVIDKRLMKAWKLHSPRDHYVCRYTGKYSKLAGFIKDSCVILTELWNIGKTDQYYREWANDAEREAFRLKDL